MYFSPGSNLAPFEEVKVPVSNSAEFIPLEDFGGFSAVRVNPVLVIISIMWLCDISSSR